MPDSSNTTPRYTFSSSEPGVISVGGSCSSSSAAQAVHGDNTITLDTLEPGTYSDCTITVTDSAGNLSASLAMNTFDVEHPPTVMIGNLEWQRATAKESDTLSSGLDWDSGKLNWDNAMSYCEGLDLDGKQDWGLPSQDQLSPLIDSSVSMPMIVDELRDTTESSSYWSSTTHHYDTSNAWNVDFNAGLVDDFTKTYRYFVHCVRGG